MRRTVLAVLIWGGIASTARADPPPTAGEFVRPVKDRILTERKVVLRADQVYEITNATRYPKQWLKIRLPGERQREDWVRFEHVGLVYPLSLRAAVRSKQCQDLTWASEQRLPPGAPPEAIGLPAGLRGLSWGYRRVAEDKALSAYARAYRAALRELGKGTGGPRLDELLKRAAEFRLARTGGGTLKVDDRVSAYTAARAVYLRSRIKALPTPQEKDRLPKFDDKFWQPNAFWPPAHVSAAEPLARAGLVPQDKWRAQLAQRFAGLPDASKWDTNALALARAQLMQLRGDFEERLLTDRPGAPIDLAPLAGALARFGRLLESDVLQSDRLTLMVLAELQVVLGELLSEPLDVTLDPRVRTPQRFDTPLPPKLTLRLNWDRLLASPLATLRQEPNATRGARPRLLLRPLPPALAARSQPAKD